MVSTFAGTVGGGFADGPALDSAFSNPSCIVMNAVRDFIVSDSLNQDIRQITSNGDTRIITNKQTTTRND